MCEMKLFWHDRRARGEASRRGCVTLAVCRPVDHGIGLTFPPPVQPESCLLLKNRRMVENLS